MEFSKFINEQEAVVRNVVQGPRGIELRFTDPSLDAPLIGMAPTKDMNQWQVKTTKGVFLVKMAGEIGRPLYEKWRKSKGWDDPVAWHTYYGKGWARDITPKNIITIYRGIAGEFIPYSEDAKRQYQAYQKKLNDMFPGDISAQMQWLKNNPKYYNKIFALSRVDKTQNATPNLKAAIDYAIATSKRTGIKPPLVIAINVSTKELPEPVGSVGNEVFDIPSQEFTRLFQKNKGRILSIPEAQQLMAKLYPSMISAIGTR